MTTADIPLYKVFLTIAIISNSILNANNVKGKRVEIGAETFYKLIEDCSIAVDKTLLIKSFLEIDGKVLLVTYPHKWGKTVNSDMVKSFLQIEVYANGSKKAIHDSSNRFFFTHKPSLEIAKRDLQITFHGKPYKPDELVGRFPVIAFSMKNVTRPDDDRIFNWNRTVNQIRLQISETFLQHQYIGKALENVIEHTGFDDDTKRAAREDLDVFYAYMNNGATRQEVLVDSLRFLSKLLHKHWGKKVFIFLDDYDRYVAKELLSKSENQCGDFEKALKPVMSLIEDFYKVTFQVNEHLEKAFITGTLRVHSGISNVTEVNSVNGHFGEYYGFTTTEIQNVLMRGNFQEQDLVMESWFQGYVIKETDIYNPWSSINYIRDIYSRPQSTEIKPYWKDISEGPVNFISEAFKNPRILYALSMLLKNALFPVASNEPLTLHDIVHLQKLSRKNGQKISPQEGVEEEKLFMNLLIMTGYLAVVETKTGIHSVLIPNIEIDLILRREFLAYLESTYDIFLRGTMRSLQNVIRSPANTTLQEECAKNFTRLLEKSSIRSKINEEHLRAVLAAGVAAHISKFQFVGLTVIANGDSEKGIGLAIAIEDHFADFAVLFEIKSEKSPGNPFQQIKDKKNVQVFGDDKFDRIEEIILIGISLSEDTRRVQMITKVIGRSEEGYV